jgi:hypothetical protein
VPEHYWQHLFALAGGSWIDLEQQAVDGLRRYRYEKAVQDWLYSYPGLLARHGLRNLTDPRKELFLPREASPTSSSPRAVEPCDGPSSWNSSAASSGQLP